MELGRLLTAMVTPFDAELNVDYKAAERLAQHLIDTGTQGIVVSGTTGESPTLTTAEKLELFRVVKRVAEGKAAVVAGTGNYCTAESIELSREAEQIGVDAVMLVAPYYNKPPQEAMYQHFAAVAGETGLPAMIYNVPGRTSVNILPETLARLSRIANIQAVKEASGVLDQASEIARTAEPGFQILSGDDSLTLPMMAVGGQGIVSVASHVAGRQIRAMIEAFVAGRVAEAKDLHLRLMPLFKACFVTTNPIPVKAALRLAGFDAGGCRLPLIDANPKEIEVVRQAMDGLGLLAS